MDYGAHSGTVRPGVSTSDPFDFDMMLPVLSSPLTNAASPSSTPGVTLPSFNPSSLLNPKAAAAKSKAEPQPKAIQSNGDADDSANGDGPSNFLDLMERHHGVTKREAPSLKRNKNTEDDEDDLDKKRAKFIGTVGKGGIIGESVREMRQQAQDEKPITAIEIDSTEDDDDCTIVSVKKVGSDTGKQEVCIGVINAKILANRVPFIGSRAFNELKGTWPPAKMTIGPGLEGPMRLDVIDRRGLRFANLDHREASGLAPLLKGSKLHGLRLNVILEPRPKKEGQVVGDAISEQMAVKVGVFCQRDAEAGIRRTLSHRQIFLQKPIGPITDHKEVVYPERTVHGPKQTAAPGRNSNTVNVSFFNRTVEEIKNDVQNIIDSLPNSEGLEFAEADAEVVNTPLLDHQKQALYWLTKKETASKDGEGTLWKWRPKKDGSDSWYNVISGQEAKAIPVSMGGLFSDAMGLGKTLSILALVASTLELATAFEKQAPSAEIRKEHPLVRRNHKATLIVCPKSVLSNWDEQIKTHLNSSRIKFYTYHGDKRQQDLKKLADYDIIITSYSIVESEYRNRNSARASFKALTLVNWFRVVLDEAHMIRNMNTGAFAATNALASSRRWGVTGTPVQNRLDDLGALIRFIRVAPFHEKGQWELNFTSAWKSGNEQVLPNLKLLVGSTMLRRSKKTIDMEEPESYTEYLDFTAEERGLYEAFAKDSHKKMQAMTRNGKLGAHGTAHMLTFISRLRQICAHGKDLLSDEDMKLLDGSTVGTAIDLGDEDEYEKPSMTDHQIYDFFLNMRASDANVCVYDDKEVIGKGDDEEPAEDPSSSDESEDETEPSGTSTPTEGSFDSDVLGYVTPCFHLISRKHIERFRAEIAPSVTTDGYGICPKCEQYIRANPPAILRSGLQAEEAARAAPRTRGQTNSAPYSGPHTKVKALLSHLGRDDELSRPLEQAGEPPIRSVVFSGWTKYLDLIGIALEDAGIAYLRLDGKLSVRARSAVLAQFRADPAITVLLVSIRAGGQGLNLTAASRAYVMEPQFNPGVEMQAVDRVHRLGQTRPVRVVKFVMADSFETRILKLQEQKLKLAREAFGEGEKGGSTAKERLEGLRSLFR